jgi:hypothetical protein
MAQQAMSPFRNILDSFSWPYLALRRARGLNAAMTDPFLVDLETGKPLRSADALNEALRRAFLDAGALSRDQVYPPDRRLSPRALVLSP